ncbi:lipoate--protein ligase family protein [Planctomycetes bacterium K23_9]|uniref:Lipoate-protein ligase LplJ n=1 Tax=Stieleria marina TaxID=1930275 RepID=A0A517P1P5_9BACT|nr:Lipoate-protein ligase LplJ [Planctomycetes bacterium K23_9]
MTLTTESITNPSDHLSLDEAALLLADSDEIGESFRVWEFAEPTVVVGRSTKVGYEINRQYCHDNQIPILRRCSGGASIVGGPGCMMYSVVLRLDSDNGLRQIDAAHRHVMQRVLTAVQDQIPQAKLQGTCDLTYRDRKFSGNSLRIARSHLLYHGTILYAADLDRVANCLADAPRQPDYRLGRTHEDFVTNVAIDSAVLASRLSDVFGIEPPRLTLPVREEMQRLRTERYDNPQWHFRHE